MSETKSKNTVLSNFIQLVVKYHNAALYFFTWKNKKPTPNWKNIFFVSVCT